MTGEGDQLIVSIKVVGNNFLNILNPCISTSPRVGKISASKLIAMTVVKLGPLALSTPVRCGTVKILALGFQDIHFYINKQDSTFLKNLKIIIYLFWLQMLMPGKYCPGL